MAQDIPPTDETILGLIHDADGAVDPEQLIKSLANQFEMVAIIESLQRGIERRKITLDGDGMIVVARELEKAA